MSCGPSVGAGVLGLTTLSHAVPDDSGDVFLVKRIC